MNERSAKAWQLPPEVLEWLFTLAAVAFLVWQTAAFREPDFLRGAGGRYREAVELRAPMLPQAAGTGRVAALNPADPAAFAELTKAKDALAQSLLLPIKARLSRLDEFENRAREARAETDVQGAIASLGNETRLYREAYGITPEGAHSVPIDCAWNYFAAQYQAPAGTDADRARSLVGMAALLDGDAARATAAAATPGAVKAGVACAALGPPGQVAAAAATLVASARASESNAAKSNAAQELLTNAHWYFALWAVAGLLLLQFGRRAVHARRFLPLAGLLWAVVGWITHVHVEWLSDRGAQSVWLLRSGIRWPDFFQLAIAAAVVLLLLGIVFAPARNSLSAPVRQTPSSRIGYAGFVLFAGLGWWLLLDLSASGHYANRFHALYQQVYVYAAFVLLTLLAPIRLLLAERLGRRLGSFVLLTRLRREGLRRFLPWVAYTAAIAALLLAAAVLRKYQTQLTSEIFRLWLVLGVSWFFFVRGETALALVAGGGGSGSSGTMNRGLARFTFLWPLLFVLCVPLAGLVLTDDFGPLFVMLYAASIFFGAAVAFAFVDRAGYRPWLGGAVGVLIAGAWVYLLTFALYSLPAPLARIAERLESVRTPFAATNDQLAIITWFQESAPAGGYGIGSVPWCGEIAAAGCRGVPRQIQSDYVFTALVGVYGKAAALGLVALLAFWLVRVVIHHGRASRGTVVPGSTTATQQAWLSWIAVCWVGLTLAQLAITVAGNLGWLPLTGITFPFASFGAWSLLANTMFLGLAISLPRRS
jgi:cell division protein FtsW (lipid II flippase)